MIMQKVNSNFFFSQNDAIKKAVDDIAGYRLTFRGVVEYFVKKMKCEKCTVAHAI